MTPINNTGAQRWQKLLPSAGIAAVFLILGGVMWATSGYFQAFFFFGYIGVAVGVGLGLYAWLPKKKKPWGRRLSLILVGSFLLIFMGVIQSENMQIEWAMFSILAGLMGAALTHYLIAKVFGPMLFGRLWCGWACWTVMVLDLLPFKRSPGRLPGKWGWGRFAHFGLSFALVAVLWYGFSFAEHIEFGSAVGLMWLLAGNALYYAVGIGLAFALKDNRAFCKYVCPVSVPLKATSRFSLLKIKGDAGACTGCEACDKMCPMDIRVSEYVQSGDRVLSTECTLCQTCITVCAKDALSISAGFDMGGKEHLRIR